MTGLSLRPVTPVTPAGADAPNLVSGFGITAGAWRWITGRTLEVDLATAKVAANSVNGPHRGGSRSRTSTSMVSVPVNTASNTNVVVYGGLWANGDTWLQLDDVTAAAS